MQPLAETAPAFVEMAHRIVWCTVATVDADERPRSRILHPVWMWDGTTLTGWIGTSPTPTKRTHFAAHPYASCTYWEPSQDTCVAECHAELIFDAGTRTMVWDLFKQSPEPVGYDPAIVPTWEEPTSDSFAVIKLEPWRLRVFPGTVLYGKGGDILTWRA